MVMEVVEVAQHLAGKATAEIFLLVPLDGDLQSCQQNDLEVVQDHVHVLPPEVVPLSPREMAETTDPSRMVTAFAMDEDTQH
jgi:hypothetical protein